MKPKPEIILLFFLILLGAVMLSSYARWTTTTTFPNIWEFFGHIALLAIVVFFYCFGTTAFFTRITQQGYIISPLLVWLYIWLINLIGSFYQVGLSLDVSGFAGIVTIYFFVLVIVFYIAYPQATILRKVFGFSGDEEDCYYKSYTVSENFDKIVNILSKKGWLFYMSQLITRISNEPNRFKMKAYGRQRRCYLFFFVEKTNEEESILNIVSYVKNATNFASFIDSPQWCKELTENIVAMIHSKGVKMQERTDLKLKKEAFEYALREIKPLISRESLEKISLPLFLLSVLAIALTLIYSCKLMELSLVIGFGTLGLAFIEFIFDYLRKR